MAKKMRSQLGGFVTWDHQAQYWKISWLRGREEKKIKKNPKAAELPLERSLKTVGSFGRLAGVLLKPGHQHPSPTHLLAEDDARRQSPGAVTRTMRSALPGHNTQLPASPPTAAATASTSGPGEMTGRTTVQPQMTFAFRFPGRVSAICHKRKEKAWPSHQLHSLKS